MTVPTQASHVCYFSFLHLLFPRAMLPIMIPVVLIGKPRHCVDDVAKV